MNITEIIELVAREENMSKKDTERVFSGIIKAIKTSVNSGEIVNFRGFGSFQLLKTPARYARNPQTGARISVAGSKRVKFRHSKYFFD